MFYQQTELASAQSFFHEVGNSISRWFDHYIGFDSGTDFPRAIIASNGKAITSLISGLTGRQVIGLSYPGLCTPSFLCQLTCY